ncbi:retrovirus-related pol polyprotein from transposon RE1 [Tanacetum coccineum]
MDPPLGVECNGNMCRLKKALYGLKQSPGLGLEVTALIVYVDDMVVTGNDPEEMKNLQTILATEFELKDLGHLKYFLGIEVARSKSGISMCQHIAYAVSVVSRFMHAPSKVYMKAVYRILKYLKSSPGKGLFFGKNQNHQVCGYTNADWAGDRTDGTFLFSAIDNKGKLGYE